MIPTTPQEITNELKKYIEALSGYEGNEVTHFQPRKNLMIEERINIIEDAVSLAIALLLQRENEGED